MKKIFSIICLLAVIQSGGSQAKVFNAETFTLDNGLQVIVVPNHRAPVVTHMVWYKVGAIDEPQGLSGMAHYLEHLLFKGTETLAPGEFSRIVKRLGGNDNAFTGQDYTAYFQSIPKQHLPEMMMMEADRMVNLKVPLDHFALEKKVVLEERRQRTENDPKGLFGEQMRSALFVNHAYGTPVIGWMHEIKEYEWDDIEKFYQSWYAPNNAIVIISGDVTADEVRPMVAKSYGKVKAKELPERLTSTVPPSIGDTVMTLSHPTIHQPTWQNIRLAPSYGQNKTDSLALQVLEEIMSGNATARLYQNLVVDKKRAVSIGLSYSGSARDTGTLSLYGSPAEGVSLDELAVDVQNEIKAVITDGVTEDEVKEAVQRMQDSADYARDSLSGPAMTIGFNIMTGSTLDDIENWPEDISGVTAEDVKRVAALYLNDDKPWRRVSVTGHLIPMKKEDEPVAKMPVEKEAAQ